jgi:hypothetical protein
MKHKKKPLGRIKLWLIYKNLLFRFRYQNGNSFSEKGATESMIMKEYLPIVPLFFESSEFSRNLRFSHLY